MSELLTTTEVSDRTGYSRQWILNKARRFNFTRGCKYFLKKTKGGNFVKEYMFSEEQIEKMGLTDKRQNHPNLFKSNDTKQPVIKEGDSEYIARMKIEHPLVTDERCFITSWFPDTEPLCFKDLEE